MPDIAVSPPNLQKRRVGRPKGSKNKPNAGNKGNPVGRPRKNQPQGVTGTQNARHGSQGEIHSVSIAFQQNADFERIC